VEDEVVGGLTGEISMDNKAFRRHVDTIRRSIKELEDELFFLEEHCCDHEVVLNEDGDAVCQICGGHLGAYCEEAPDHTCNIGDAGTCIHCGREEYDASDSK